MIELRQASLETLATSQVSDKVSQVFRLFDDFERQVVSIDTAVSLSDQGLMLPGRPTRPELIPPLQVPKRKMDSVEGRASLLHSLAHIEFNAINLALDAIWRFKDMPKQYYVDWLRVAKEEAYHFTLVNDYIQTFGYTYGDFSAHNGLWEMVERTTDKVIARMALVPRTMEARGLDAVPLIRDRFQQIREVGAVEILDIILRDEIGHVAIGNHWFNYLCERDHLSPVSTYQSLAEKYRAPKLKKPFNFEARRQAGFTDEELSQLGV
jgi:uncharacterized ferritin-like protein (DUF455 family)